MSRVITFSRYFPKGHSRAGEPTFFVEQILNVLGDRSSANGIVDVSALPKDVQGIVNDFVLLSGEMKKHHTIRAGNRWKVGDKFSPRVWSGKPYRSPQITIGPDIEIVKIWNFRMSRRGVFSIETGLLWPFWERIKELNVLAANDGLADVDFYSWFMNHPKAKKEGFRGQILCWSENIQYQ
jgi:hypothetical protein